MTEPGYTKEPVRLYKTEELKDKLDAKVNATQSAKSQAVVAQGKCSSGFVKRFHPRKQQSY